MSERFEQKVKILLDEVQFEPHDKVWNNVRHAIKPERKRKRLIFWWILPVALAGATLIYVNNRSETITVSPGPNEHSITKVHEPAVNKIVTPSERLNHRDLPGINKMNENASVVHPHNSFNKTEKQIRRTNISTNKKPAAGSGAKIGQPVIPVQEELVTTNGLPSKKSISGIQKNSDTVSTSVAVNQPQHNPIKETVSYDSSYQSNANIPVKVDLPKPKWRVGLTLDMGLASKVSGLLLSSQNSVRTSFGTIPNVSSGVSASPQYQRYSAKPQLLWGAGVSVQKGLNTKFTFLSGVGYQYQSFKTEITNLKDSVSAGIRYAVPVERYKESYDLYMLNVFTGLSYRLVKFNDLHISLGTGLHNQFILSTGYQQKKYTGNSTQPVSVINFPGTSIKAWQPHLDLRIIADLNPKETQFFQLAPYLRYGLRNFEKQTGKKDHLLSFGISASYFFK